MPFIFWSVTQDCKVLSIRVNLSAEKPAAEGIAGFRGENCCPNTQLEIIKKAQKLQNCFISTV
jgi:hypothetical protein